MTTQDWMFIAITCGPIAVGWAVCTWRLVHLVRAERLASSDLSTRGRRR